MALGLAASLASGLKANFGTMTKPLHVGHSARNGLFAALMVREGFTANPAALEAQARLPRRVQRPRHLRHRSHPGRLVCAAGSGRRRRAGAETISLLRLHAFLDQPHDPPRAHARPDAGARRDDRDHAASAPPAAHQQSRSTHAARARSSASSTWWRARWRIARCGWSTSRATRISIPPSATLMARTDGAAASRHAGQLAAAMGRRSGGDHARWPAVRLAAGRLRAPRSRRAADDHRRAVGEIRRLRQALAAGGTRSRRCSICSSSIETLGSIADLMRLAGIARPPSGGYP